jgi:hypothetical protein
MTELVGAVPQDAKASHGRKREVRLDASTVPTASSTGWISGVLCPRLPSVECTGVDTSPDGGEVSGSLKPNTVSSSQLAPLAELHPGVLERVPGWWLAGGTRWLEYA